MNTLSLSSSESSNKITTLVNAIADACSALAETFQMTFDKVSAYGIKSLQGVYSGVKSLFVDVILNSLKKIEVMMHEMKKNGSDLGCSPEHIQSLILLQKSQLTNKLQQHAFFRENFERRVNEVFA